MATWPGSTIQNPKTLLQKAKSPQINSDWDEIFQGGWETCQEDIAKFWSLKDQTNSKEKKLKTGSPFFKFSQNPPTWSSWWIWSNRLPDMFITCHNSYLTPKTVTSSLENKITRKPKEKRPGKEEGENQNDSRTHLRNTDVPWMIALFHIHAKVMVL
jgi:hypothetical protein